MGDAGLEKAGFPEAEADEGGSAQEVDSAALQRPRRRVVVWRALSLALGIAVLVWLLYWAGADSLDALRTADPIRVLAAFGVTLLLSAVSARRWADLTLVLGDARDISVVKYYRSFMAGRAAGLILPQTVSDFGVRPVVHRVSAGASGKAALAGALVERVMDGTLWLVLFPASLMYLLHVWTQAAYLMAVGAGMLLWVFVFLVLGRGILSSMAGLAERIAKRSSARCTTGWLAKMTSALGRLLSRITREEMPIRRVGISSLARFFLIIGQFVLIARSLGLPSIGWLQVLAALPAAQLGLVVGITPAGLGLVEGGFLGALIALGVSARESGVFVVGQRALISLFVLVLASGAFLLAQVSG